MRLLFLLTGLLGFQYLSAQQLSQDVNVFIGSSGDHGQMSPAASYPFGMLSIGPQTYPNLHMGYEHRAKVFLGFTHNRFEGVGCQGSGGNILIKPFVDSASTVLTKATEKAGAGFYEVGFTNHISAQIAVYKNTGLEVYHFPAGKKGFQIDLSHTLANPFVAEEHQLNADGITGWVDSRTTCGVGTYRVYYAIRFSSAVQFTDVKEHVLNASIDAATEQLTIAFSSVDTTHAKAALLTGNYEQQKMKSQQDWNSMLDVVQVQGDPARVKLFYSMLYRTIQSPYLVSEKDGSYRGWDGSMQHTNDSIYNGWAIWDNYRTQLPLLSLFYPDRYKSIANSIADIYKFGKKDYATAHEPSNTVRSEHAIVILLDAYRKGYPVDLNAIADSLVSENERLDYAHPDKALESSYDTWALWQILEILGKKDLSEKYHQKTLTYKDYWTKDFKDITRRDVDRMQARGLYQGTIWQYRWFVPFDMKGMIALDGGQDTFNGQLNYFFDNDLYNHANEPDIQAPMLFNTSGEPWRSQELIHKYAADTVIQYYFNDNSRGIDPFVDVIYQNKPDSYIRTMDDDAGAMSAWYVFAACGLMPACPGWPVYYINLPLFQEVHFNHFTIKVNNYAANRRYIQSATLNGKPLNRNWLTQQEMMKGGTLVLTAGDKPNKTWGLDDPWVTDISK
jgi:putative alpha-1,2-mannosidase